MIRGSCVLDMFERLDENNVVGNAERSKDVWMGVVWQLAVWVGT